ncbi:hypothetical protein HMPREF0378_1579 [Eubacterium nodatum ATCC 33099]|nr:hypothetical protein HMPREF0378_1579 [Eubacterium nodatum ATCC 33099]
MEILQNHRFLISLKAKNEMVSEYENDRSKRGSYGKQL